MALLIPDAAGVYIDQKPPLIYNHQLEAWQDTEGLAYNQELEAWQKVWPTTPTIELPLTDGDSFAKLVKSPESAGDIVLTQNGVTPSGNNNGGEILYYYGIPLSTFDGDFEFSANLYISQSASGMGIVGASLRKGSNVVLNMTASDPWYGSGNKEYIAMIHGVDIYQSGETSVQKNGVFAVKRVGGIMKFEFNSNELGSLACSDELVFDKIAVGFTRYKGYPVSTMYIKDIYVGAPRD